MWRDQVNKLHWWHEIKGQIDKLIRELEKAEDEEDACLYLLNLHKANKHDYKCFNTQEKKLIKNSLAFLISETLKHRTLLSEIEEELKAFEKNRHE